MKIQATGGINDTIMSPRQAEGINDTIMAPRQVLNDTIDTAGIELDEPGMEEQNDTIVEDELKRGAGVILDSKVEYKARDTIRFDISNQIVYLFGGADIKHEDIHLEADYIEIDFKKNEIYARGMPDSLGIIQGKPIFTEKGQRYRTEELRYNFETEKGRTTNVITEESDGFLHGSVVKIMEDETIHVGGGKYTTCDKDDPHFHIGFRRAKVMDNMIISGPAFFYLNNIPTPAIIPFGFFPNTTEQSSGLIVPSYGESGNRGFYLRDGGFYWGVSDYFDLSLKGDIYSRGSWGLKKQTRYNKRYKYSGNFNINYAINIDGEEGLPGYSRRNDFRVVWSHNQDPRARPNSSFRANVNAGSSQYNRYDPSTTEDYLSNTFSSNISYSASWDEGRYNFSTNLRHSQNTITEKIEMQLPEVAFSISRFNPFRSDDFGGERRWYEDIGMSYSMNARNRIETTDSLFFKRETWRNMENGIQHSIPVSHSFNLLNHFNVSSSINYSERWYFQSIEKHWSDEVVDETDDGDPVYEGLVTDTVPGFVSARDFSISTGIGTNIYGMRGFKRGPVSAIRHIVRPNIGFSFRPDFSDPFWGYYKQYTPLGEEPVSYSTIDGIYGRPTSERSGSINFSLGNNLEIKTRPKTREEEEEEEGRKITLIESLRISTSYNFARDSLNLSDINVSGRTRLFDNLNLTFRGNWTPYLVDENNNKINKFIWEEKNKLFQMTNTSWNLSLSYRLSGGEGRPQNGNGQEEINQNGDLQSMGNQPPQNGMMSEFDEPGPPPTNDVREGIIDYSVPWNINFDYNFNYSSRVVDQNTSVVERDFTQTLSFNGDIRLTPKWRIGVSSGYDLENHEFTYTSVNIYRDLHCWEMTINWVPFGFRRSYNLTIRVKSQVLRDLKYEQRRDFFDF